MGGPAGRRGTRGRLIAEAAIERGLDPERVALAIDADQAVDCLADGTGGTLLVKGAPELGLERVTAAALEEEADTAHLPRRGPLSWIQGGSCRDGPARRSARQRCPTRSRITSTWFASACSYLTKPSVGSPVVPDSGSTFPDQAAYSWARGEGPARAERARHPCCGDFLPPRGGQDARIRHLARALGIRARTHPLDEHRKGPGPAGPLAGPRPDRLGSLLFRRFARVRTWKAGYEACRRYLHRREALGEPALRFSQPRTRGGRVRITHPCSGQRAWRSEHPSE